MPSAFNMFDEQESVDNISQDKHKQGELPLPSDLRDATLKKIEKLCQSLTRDLALSYNVYGVFQKSIYSRAGQLKIPGGFTMIYTKRAKEVTADILDGKLPNVTLRVWHVGLMNSEWKTGRITLNRAEIAKRARCKPEQVSRAMTNLVKYGAVWREGERGKPVIYNLMPDVGWIGGASEFQTAGAGLVKLVREKAAAEAG